MKKIVELAWDNRSLLKEKETISAIRTTIDMLDNGKIRVAQPSNNGWIVNEWIKKAVILYFPIQKMQTTELGPLEFHDKIPLKKGYAKKRVRVVPHAIARHGAYISSGAVSYTHLRAHET